MAVTRPRTLDEFLLMPEEQPALEYERGEITQKMSPMARHGKIQGALFVRFERHSETGVAVEAFTETRVIWPDEGISYIPDVIAYLAGRVPVDADGEILDRLVVPPDVAVEIQSPGQVLGTQMDRCRWYVQHGVPVALLVRPDRRVVWVFRPDGEAGPFQGTDIVDLGDAIPGFSFVVADLFAVFRPRRG